jgi:uncharacterized membrane protein (DUF106 family)
MENFDFTDLEERMQELRNEEIRKMKEKREEQRITNLQSELMTMCNTSIGCRFYDRYGT